MPRWTPKARAAQAARARQQHTAGVLKGRPPKWKHLGTMVKIEAAWPTGLRELLIERLGLDEDVKDQAIVDRLVIEPIYKDSLSNDSDI